MKLPPSDPDLGIPNMMPLIDIIFLLLIFFLMASSFKQEEREERERELKAMLPEVSEAQPLSSTEDLIVNITSEGRYVVGGKELTEAQLASLLEQTHRANPHKPVLIRGDGRAPWKHGVRVMGLCNKARIGNYRVAALQEPQSAP